MKKMLFKNANNKPIFLGEVQKSNLNKKNNNIDKNYGLTNRNIRTFHILFCEV